MKGILFSAALSGLVACATSNAGVPSEMDRLKSHPNCREVATGVECFAEYPGMAITYYEESDRRVCFLDLELPRGRMRKFRNDSCDSMVDEYMSNVSGTDRYFRREDHVSQFWELDAEYGKIKDVLLEEF